MTYDVASTVKLAHSVVSSLAPEAEGFPLTLLSLRPRRDKVEENGWSICSGFQFRFDWGGARIAFAQ